jgi:hypothetical protein
MQGFEDLSELIVVTETNLVGGQVSHVLDLVRVGLGKALLQLLGLLNQRLGIFSQVFSLYL